MKDLLSKEHYCYKIHILLLKSSAYLLFYRHPPPLPLRYMGYPLILQENLDPPLLRFLKNCNPPIML